MSATPDGWQAKFDREVLHISGCAKYPNQFSTAGLERLEEKEDEFISYRIVFHRDKEPFCGIDLIGPVHHFDRAIHDQAKQVRVFSIEAAKTFPIER